MATRSVGARIFVCVKKSSSLVFAERPTKFFEPSSLLPLSLCIATVNLAGAGLTNSMCYKTAFFLSEFRRPVEGRMKRFVIGWLFLPMHRVAC